MPVHDAASMDEAVRLAFAMAAPGGVVLLAPACASFDMFADYAARGGGSRRPWRDWQFEVKSDVREQ